VILFDTGPNVAAAAENDEHFHTSSQLFTGLRLANRRLPLPATVSAEVGYLLSERVGPEIEVQFLQGVAEGAFELVDLARADYRRMA
jgi:predicted nucleic acid-binding protein